MSDFIMLALVAWLICFGIKVETEGVRFYINGWFKTYTLEDKK